MAKLDRVLQKIFGSSGGGSEFGEIGSLAAGTPVYSKDLDTIQSLTQFLEGLFALTNSGAQPPRIQDINSLYLLVTSQLKYLFQAGVPEYIATEDYYIGSICQVAGVLYTSIADANTGNTVSDVSKWKKTLDIAELSGFGADWISVLSAAMVSGWKAAFQATLAANVAHVLTTGLGTNWQAALESIIQANIAHVLTTGLGTNWQAALESIIQANIAHVLTTGLGVDWQAALEGAANTAVKTNVAAACSGNSATASSAAALSGCGYIYGAGTLPAGGTFLVLSMSYNTSTGAHATTVYTYAGGTSLPATSDVYQFNYAYFRITN